jgi:hypothetical protein
MPQIRCAVQTRRDLSDIWPEVSEVSPVAADDPLQPTRSPRGNIATVSRVGPSPDFCSADFYADVVIHYFDWVGLYWPACG